MDHKAYIKKLIQTDVKKAIEQFVDGAQGTDLESPAILLSARYNNNEKANRSGTISHDNYNRTVNQISNSLTSYLEEYQPNPSFTFTAPTEPAAPPSEPSGSGDESSSTKTKVFLSYRHANEVEAKKVKEYLEEKGLDILIDYEQIDAGENIRAFIIRMIRESDVTLSLVSAKSLESAWVGMESDLTMMSELFQDETKFITCSLDYSFFDSGFRNECLKKVKEKITGLEGERQESKELFPDLDTVDLDSEISRYKEYFSNLPKIIQRLKENLTIDISGENFQPGLDKVLSSL